MIQKKITRFLIHVIVPLFLGSFIYIYFRQENAIAFERIRVILEIQPIISSNQIIHFIINSFPDFCWLYAFLSLQTQIIWGSIKKIPLILRAIMYIFPILTEMMQYLHIISGTADWGDIIAYLLAILLNFYIWRLKKQET